MYDLICLQTIQCAILKGGDVSVARPSNIIFSNLRAEMARQQITIQGIASVLGVGRDAASQKLSGKTPITLAEAFQIEKQCFPDSDIRYLFSELSDATRDVSVEGR